MPSVTNLPPSYSTSSPSNGGLVPRYANMLLSIWLCISAFAWAHVPAQRTNTWIVGVFMFIVAIVAVGQPKARYWNSVAASISSCPVFGCIR